MDKDISDLLRSIPFGFAVWPGQKEAWIAAAKHQEDVIRVMAVLPGKHRYEQVEAAINAAGISPYGLYVYLCANEWIPAVGRFYEALGTGKG